MTYHITLFFPKGEVWAKGPTPLSSFLTAQARLEVADPPPPEGEDFSDLFSTAHSALRYAPRLCEVRIANLDGAGIDMKWTSDEAV